MQINAVKRLHRDIPQSYSGNYLNSAPHGEGSLALPNESYTGGFKFGLRDGFGQQISTEYAFRGFFEHDAPSGDGILVVDNMRIHGKFRDGFKAEKAACELNTGEVLYGEFNSRKFEGVGTVRSLNEFYSGQITNNQYNGQGTLVGPDFQYSGSFRNGLRHGIGEEVCGNESYKGSFVNDKRHGHGELTTPDYVFNGDFADGYKAVGRIVYRDGAVYEGTFRYNQRCGKGRLVIPQRISFEGEFQEDEIVRGSIKKTNYLYEGEIKGFKPVGQGQLTTENGVYRGRFVKGLISGNATFENDILKYQGQFNEKFEFHGTGILYYKAKRGKLSGRFLNGKAHGKCQYEDEFEYFEGFYQNGSRQGSGILRHGGVQYTGEFEFGRKSGRGIEISENGDVFQGMFRNDEKMEGILQSSSRSPDRAAEQPKLEIVEFDDGTPMPGEVVFRKIKSFRDISFRSRPSSAATTELGEEPSLCLTSQPLHKSQSISRGMTKSWRREDVSSPK